MTDVPENGAAPWRAWLWRGVTLALAGAAVAAALAARRERLAPDVLANDEEALRRACLEFPWPVLLRGRRVHAFRGAETGTQSLSYRVPAAYPVETIHAYYAEHLRANGFGAEQGGAIAREVPVADYADEGRRRVATVAVHTAPGGQAHRTVVLMIRPAARAL